MSSNTKPVITVDEMKARAAACLTSIEAIQTRLQEGLLSAGPAPAQAARLVAFAYAKTAYNILEDVNASLQFLSASARTPSPEGESNDPLEELVGAQVEVAQEVVEAMMEQLGVEKEAIAPFLYETNAKMLPIIEDMVATATAKLNEADAVSAATPAS